MISPPAPAVGVQSQVPPATVAVSAPPRAPASIPMRVSDTHSQIIYGRGIETVGGQLRVLLGLHQAETVADAVAAHSAALEVATRNGIHAPQINPPADGDEASLLSFYREDVSGKFASQLRYRLSPRVLDVFKMTQVEKTTDAWSDSELQGVDIAAAYEAGFLDEATAGKFLREMVVLFRGAASESRRRLIYGPYEAEETIRREAGLLGHMVGYFAAMMSSFLTWRLTGYSTDALMVGALSFGMAGSWFSSLLLRIQRRNADLTSHFESIAEPLEKQQSRFRKIRGRRDAAQSSTATTY